MRRMLVVAAVAAFATSVAGVAEKGTPVRKLSDIVSAIDMRNLLKMPVGDTLLGVDMWYAPLYGELASVKVPHEWSDRARCDALRVSDIIVDSKTKSICGSLGSNVYRTAAEGAFAITNQIVSAVSAISLGKTMVVPLRFEAKNRYCEMTFTWRPNPAKSEERELVVRGYVNGKRQMAVCCFLHTKGDGVEAGRLQENGLWWGSSSKAGNEWRDLIYYHTQQTEHDSHSFQTRDCSFIRAADSCGMGVC